MDFSPFEKKKNEILLNNITPPFKPPVAILCLVQVSSSILQYFITPTSLWVFYQHNMDAQRVNIWLSKQGGRNVFQGFSRKRKLSLLPARHRFNINTKARFSPDNHSGRLATPV